MSAGPRPPEHVPETNYGVNGGVAYRAACTGCPRIVTWIGRPSVAFPSPRCECSPMPHAVEEK